MTLAPFALERYFARHEFTVEFVLCASDCESVSVAELLALEPDASSRFGAQSLGYTESPGRPSLREEVARLYTTVRPDDVLVHCGAEEAIFTLMHAVLTAGDHAIVHAPCYQSLVELPRSLGCDVSPWTAREALGWALDLDDLRRLWRPTTRLVVVNTPHNPTGWLMPREAFEDLARFCDRRGVVLFSDEVYRELEHAPGDRLPAGVDLSGTAVSLGVMSKTYGLPGLRIGWVATHDTRLLARMAQVKDYTTICNSAPSEFLAELALRHRHRLARRNLELVLANLTLLDGFFARHADRFAWQRPRAGPIAFPRLRTGDVETFCDDLAQRAGVLLLPGTVYGDIGNHFRIGFGRRSLPEALARFEGHVGRPAAGG